MIEVSGLTVCYNNDAALADISLTISKGSLTSVVGPNGCGKTTLLKALAGLLPAASGHVSISGKPIAAMTGPERAKHIAYLPQSRPVPDITTLTMIRHGRFPHQRFARKLSPADHAAVEAAVVMTGTEPFLNKLVPMLSGGERQRVYIAMALAQGADILLLDEPASGLDLRYQIELMNMLEKLHRLGKTIVMVTHDLPFAFTYSEQVCLLDRGRLARQARSEDTQLHALLPEIFGYALRRAENADVDLYRYKIIKGE
jgi:iron complex transport system ATP-binding protein